MDRYSEAMRALLENAAIARGPQIELPVMQSHEIVVAVRAAEINTWLAEEFAKLRAESDQVFKQIRSFHQRSIAQRRRFWRMRTLMEKTA